MTYLSVQATSIQSITRTLTWALRAHLDAVAEKAVEVLFPGGAPPGVDMRAVCLGFVETLQRSADDVAQRDRNVARKRIADEEARERRDQAVGDLRAAVFVIRDAVSSVFGAGALRAAGLNGRIPDQAEPLLTYARNAAEKLPALAAKPRTKGFVQLDLAAAAAELHGLADVVSAALADVARNTRETQMAQSLRNHAVERWRLHYSMSASLFEGLLRLAGFDHVADRVRPTRRRRAGETEPEDSQETQPPAGDAPADDGGPTPGSPAPSDPAE
ncbi:MAG TPA: hypothetical protein VNM90_27225 [Haliangium sp.]|nr:hypothetical protein [Haliangium sp.]